MEKGRAFSERDSRATARRAPHEVGRRDGCRDGSCDRLESADDLLDSGERLGEPCGALRFATYLPLSFLLPLPFAGFFAGSSDDVALRAAFSMPKIGANFDPPSLSAIDFGGTN